MIYLFGGHDKDVGDLNTIWQYEIAKNKWKLLNIRMPFKMSSFGCFVTNNEKQIIFFGGESNGKLMDKILIFDTIYTSFKLSSIKCPVAMKYHAILMANDSVHLFADEQYGRHWTMKLQSITRKHTNLAAKYEDDEDEQKMVNADAPKLGPGSDSIEIKQNNEEIGKSVNQHLNVALNEINNAILKVKQNANNGNKQEIDFAANVAKLQNAIDELMQFKKNVDVLQYKTWTLDQMVLWISQIESGRFCQYIDVLKSGFVKTQIVNGSELPDINSLMLKKPPFNIQNGKDRDDLVKYFISLSDGNEYGGTLNEGGNNPNANNGEGEGAAETAGGNMVYM